MVKSDQVFGPNRTFQAGLVDLDSDGDLDAVLPNRGQIHSQILINDGKGYFTDSGQKLAQQTHGMGIGDLDNDGDQDIVFTTAGYGVDGVLTYLPTSVYLYDGQAVFKETGQDFGDDAENLGGYVIDVSDIDSDGDLDFIKSFFRDPSKIYLNDGWGWF
ncbi:FG-GAP repeat domain-containing protein, partial [Acidobacteriota bacterium]